MFSPVSDGEAFTDDERMEPRRDKKERPPKTVRSTVESNREARHRSAESNPKRHHHKSRRRHHQKRESHNRSKHNVKHKKKSKERRHVSSSSDKHDASKSSDTTFIGELMRSKAKHTIDKKEGKRLLESISKHREKEADFEPQSQVKEEEVEEGEIRSDEDNGMIKLPSPMTPPLKSFTPPLQSFTPPLHLLKVTDHKDKEKVNEPRNSQKKKSVLELPMPPIEFNRPHVSLKRSISKANATSCQPETPEFKPDHFKKCEAHFKEVQKHLDVNPSVISPDDVKSVLPTFVPRRRPTIIKRVPSAPEFEHRSFNSFEIIEQIGEGTYGKVFKAMDLHTKHIVAMKYVRMEKENEGFPITGLREIKILRELHHPNIVQLREIVYKDSTNNKVMDTYLVFEYMNHDLMGLLHNPDTKFDEDSIYRIFKQLLEAICYCHGRQILHRDLKCSNILVNSGGEVKLADFGLGRKFHEDRPYTNKVITLFYRPIELLLGEEKYGTSVDIWSLGCIFGELFLRRPVFPCATELEVINAIFLLCGTPTKNSWPEVKNLPGYKTLKPVSLRRTVMDTYNKILPPLALDLFDKMLVLNPAKRISAEEALKSNWMQFMNLKRFNEPLKLPSKVDCHEMNAKIQRKQRNENQADR